MTNVVKATVVLRFVFPKSLLAAMVGLQMMETVDWHIKKVSTDTLGAHTPTAPLEVIASSFISGVPDNLGDQSFVIVRQLR